MKTSSSLRRIGMAWGWTALLWLATAATGMAGTFGDFVYEINPNYTVKISEYTGPGGAVAIPSIIDGKSVIGIGRYAFSSDTNLTSVTIPNSILYIEEYAFNYCTGLTGVAIPASVTSIGDRVFSSCTRLATITVAAGNTAYSSMGGVLYNKGNTTLLLCPEGKAGSYAIPSVVAEIADYAFLSCSKLTGVAIGAGVTQIGDSAFWGCTGLASVAIPNSVVSIGDSAFFECTSLTGITIPNSVTHIGSGAFLRCTGLTAFTVWSGNPVYSSQGGVLYNKGKTTLIQCPGGKTSCTIPSTVTRIGDGAFNWCTRLAGLAIPSTVTRIGNKAFAYCTRLTSLAIPNSVTDIGHEAFSSCTSLARITLSTRITRIRYWTFSGCTRLAGLTIPGRVTQIEDQAFANCTRLTSLTIPGSVRSIGMSAFWGCTRLARVIIGSGVASLGDWAFKKCTLLTEVYFRGNAPAVGVGVFEDTHATIYRIRGTTGWSSTLGGRPTRMVDAYEPDNILSAAKKIANGQTQRRSIHAAGNTDWAKIVVGGAGARNLVLETAGVSGDTQLWLCNGAGNTLRYDDNSGAGNFSRISVAALGPGTYYVRIREYGNDGRISAYTLRAAWTPR